MVVKDQAAGLLTTCCRLSWPAVECLLMCALENSDTNTRHGPLLMGVCSYAGCKPGSANTCWRRSYTLQKWGCKRSYIGEHGTKVQ